MSNKVSISVNRVENIATGDKNIQILISDSYDMALCDVESGSSLSGNVSALKYLIDNRETENDKINGFLDYLEEHEKGVEIDSVWYDWEEISHLFELNLDELIWDGLGQMARAEHLFKLGMSEDAAADCAKMNFEDLPDEIKG